MRAPIVVSDPSVPLLHVSVCVPRGTALDPDGKEGATRLLLRLMRRSIRGIDPSQVDETFDSLGATLGEEANRSVSGFHGGCIKRSAQPFLDLVVRTITDPEFSESEFRRLIEETQAEWLESLDNDSTLARRAFTRALFEGHPYGRLGAGTHESIGRVSLDDLCSLSSRLLCRDAIHLSSAGDVSAQEAADTLQRLRESLPAGTIEADIPDHPTGPSGRRLTFVDKPQRTQTQILIGGLGTHPNDDDHTALFIGHMIFGGTFSGRLSREVRGKRGWSYGAYSSLPFDRQRQAFSLWTFPQASDAASCIELELKLLQELIEDGVTADELEATKKYLTNSHVFTMDTAAKRAGLALERSLYELPEDYHSGHLERVQATTVDQVNAALQRRLSSKNLEIVVLGTHNEIGLQVEKSIGDLRESRIVPFDQKD